MIIETISTQFKNLQQDKLVVCKKELMHIQEVLSFSLVPSSSYTTYFEPLQTILEVQIKKIDSIYITIEENFHAINENRRLPYVFLTHCALIEENIKELLEKIELLNNKLTQIKEDHFHQYIPKASLARRYSNKAISYFIDNYINDMNPHTKKIVTIWGTHNRYKAIQIDENLKVIENTFWFYELSRLVPLLIHEAGHFHEDNETTKAYKQRVYEMTQTIGVKNILKASNIHEEILADIFALQHMGASYILALFYSQVFNSFDKLYYSDEISGCIVPEPSANYDAYARKSFELFVRLHILIDLYQDNSTDTNESIYKHIESIAIFIQSIYKTNDTLSIPNSLETLYQDNYPHWYKSYREISDTILELKNLAIASLTDRELQNYEISKTLKETLTTTWKRHLETPSQWVHPNFLRTQLLISMNLKKNYHYSSEVYLPYELTFYKLRTDTKNDIQAIQDVYKNATFFKGEDNSCYQTFGIYSHFSLSHKHPFVSRDKIKTFLTSGTQKHTHTFYTQKIPLTLLWQVNNDNNKHGAFGLIMQLQLKEGSQQNIKEGLLCLISSLASLKSYQIFKSLGPADFIFITHHQDIQAIYSLKEHFSSQTIFRKTFSTIFIENSTHNDTKLNDGYQLLSRLRVKETNAIKTQLQESQQTNFAHCIYTTSGVMDYTIEWNNEKPILAILQEIQKYTNHTSSMGMTTDIQTFIQKRYTYG